MNEQRADFAKAAMQSLIALNAGATRDDIAGEAVRQADALISALKAIAPPETR